MSRVGNAIGAGVLALLLGFGLLLMLLPSGLEGVDGSVRSTENRGRQVVFDVLRELGFSVKAWTDSPGNLPDSRDLLILHEAPVTPPGYGPAEDDKRAPLRPAGADGRRGLRAPEHYVRFVQGGGTLLAPGTPEMLEFLAETSGLTDFERLSTEPPKEDGAEDGATPDEPATGHSVVFPTGERFEVLWEPDSRFAELEPESPFEVALTDGDGGLLALSYVHGDGRIVLLVPDDEFISNRDIGDAGHALLMVRLVERYADDRRILFDEYVLGGWAPDTAVELAFAPGTFGLSVHLILLALLLVWSSAWARPFARDPVRLSPVSALMRATGFAHVVMRSNQWGLLADMLRGGVLRRLAHRQGLRMEHGAGAEGEPKDATTNAILRPLFDATDENESRRAEQLFARPVSNEEDLERLGADLLELEDRAHSYAHDPTTS